MFDNAAQPQSGLRRLAIVSTYDELCGIGSYTHKLEGHLKRHVDVTVFDLDQYLLRNKHARVQPCAREPESGGRQFKEAGILQPSQVRLARKQRGNLMPQAVGGVPVVVIPVRYDGALCGRTRAISLFPDRGSSP